MSFHRPALYVAQLPLDEYGQPIIKRVLIANRGEIACRIMETCKKLDVTSIAVYVDEDKHSTHIGRADEAINLGSIAQNNTNAFLNIPLLVRTAVAARADAVHPGYGYVSESADFADAVREAGLIFIGPSASAMSTLGDKRVAKAFLSKEAPHVPLIPGFAGSSQALSDLESAANDIGYPVMLKASAGGGGKGMRIVRESLELSEALQRAQSEAQRSFGCGDVILEKYIEAGKHVEIQIMGDSHGKVVSFSERDCSVQRRHQKVIEETPCQWLSAKLRNDISNTAISIAELIKYEGAGTVEFVLDVNTSQYYFLEVNARLQVEHPITEEVTGYDLVSLQLYVAAGGSLTAIMPENGIQQTGHAIECRLCAEDPQNEFFPEHGTVHIWMPFGIDSGERDVRHETAISTGSDVSIYFDPMIAKIVVWAPTRSQAIRKMIRVLGNTVCAGIKTNQLFLQSCLAQPAFRDPAYTTSFIPSNMNALLSVHADVKGLHSVLSILSCFLLRHQQKAPKTCFRSVASAFKNQYRGAIKNNTTIVSCVQGFEAAKATSYVCVWSDDVSISDLPQSLRMAEFHSALSSPSESNGEKGNSPVSAAQALTSQFNRLSGIVADTDDKRFAECKVRLSRCLSQSATHEGLSEDWRICIVDVEVNNAKVSVTVSIDTRLEQSSVTSTEMLIHHPLLGTWVRYRCDSLLSYVSNLRTSVSREKGTDINIVKAPMPCKVISILKKDGDMVKTSETVMVVESMKMEMNIATSVGGIFRTSLSIGSAVDEGVVLCSVE